MTGRDYLWCALNLLLDEEEEASLLCPACRAQAERQICPVCGAETGGDACGENESFNWERFEQLRKGDAN